MGRPKKQAAPPAPARRTRPRAEQDEVDPKSTPMTRALRRQLEEVKGQLQKLHLEGAADKVATSMLVAGLTQRLWALESLLAENPDIALAMSRQAAAWGEQHVRAAKALSTDLLRDLFAKAEAMERHQGQLRGLK